MGRLKKQILHIKQKLLGSSVFCLARTTRNGLYEYVLAHYDLFVCQCLQIVYVASIFFKNGI